MARRTDNDAPNARAVIATASNPKEAYSKITEAIREREDDIVRTLAPTIPRDRFLNVALQAITRSPKLLECTPASFVLALRDAAELGLEPSGLLGQAYLVPYRNRETGRMEAKLIPGYRGLIDLARRSGEIAKIEAKMVRERDVFDYRFGTDEFITHIPYLNRTGEMTDVLDPDTGLPMTDDRGNPVRKPIDAGPYIAAWIQIVYLNGEGQRDMMPLSEINNTRRRSRAADDGPWVTDFGEMGKKTIARRTLKWAPMSLTSQLNRALELDDEAEQSAGAAAVPPATARAKFLANLKGESTTPEEQPATGADDVGEVVSDNGKPTDTATETIEPEPDVDVVDDVSDLAF